MPYAADGQISETRLRDSVEITKEQYLNFLEGMQEGKQLILEEGEARLVLPPSSTEEETTDTETVTPLGEKIAFLRWSYETGGAVLQGVAVPTDDRTKLLLSAAFQRAQSNPNYEVSWKTPVGFVTLSAESIIALAEEMQDFVEACFTRERELLELVRIGTFVPALLSLGWPKNALFEGDDYVRNW